MKNILAQPFTQKYRDKTDRPCPSACKNQFFIFNFLYAFSHNSVSIPAVDFG